MDPNKDSTPKATTQTTGHLTVCILASGSKGNAILVADQQTKVLFDAGLSGIEIERRCKSKGFHPDQLDAIVVSHEHSDHIQGVGVLARRFGLPVHISKKTNQSAGSMLGKIVDIRHFECGTPFAVNTWTISPFSISHDAEDPAGFTIHNNGMKIGIATDLGVVTAMVRERLKSCQILILEANHDPEMLKNGPYPWPLKQRIQSRTGHLSNEASRELVTALKHNDLQHVVLAHLSETNNTPEKALQEVRLALNGCKTQLHVATQEVCAEIIQVQGARVQAVSAKP